MRKRMLTKGHFGALTGRIPAYVPTEKLGRLTPIRPAAAGGGYFIFKCDCGAEVSRIGRNVRKNVERGLVPRCSEACPAKVAEVAE